MNFIGEQLLPGQIGHFFIILAFIASLLATISFFVASGKTEPLEKARWLNYARGIFLRR